MRTGLFLIFFNRIKLTLRETDDSLWNVFISIYRYISFVFLYMFKGLKVDFFFSFEFYLQQAYPKSSIQNDTAKLVCTVFQKIILLLFYYSCLHLSPPPSHPPPPSPDCTPLGFVHVSFIVVPKNPSLFLPYPLQPPLWLLSDCS